MSARVILFAKGLCMGVADVIPGVSGGTLALVLGIYQEFVDSIKGLNLRWVGLLMKWLRGGRTRADRDALVSALRALNLPFLLTLGAGIATAIVVGSAIIPSLMAAYPTLMRAFFFGLILASVMVPAQLIRASARGNGQLVGALVLALVCTVFGYWVTDPSRQLQLATTWSALESREESLKDLMRRGPSAGTGEQVYWADQNGALRDTIAATQPEVHQRLEALRASSGEEVADKAALKARNAPYEEVMLPAQVAVSLPRPALWFVFVAGAIAICAMILPGISGSYILLIFGVYFFILNALKGALSLLASGSFPTQHVMYLGVFIAAMAVGILGFSRVLSYLLHRHSAATLGALVGLMIGCLRGIWPFRKLMPGGVEVNVWPATFGVEVLSALGVCLLGVAIVIGLSFVGRISTSRERRA